MPPASAPRRPGTGGLAEPLRALSTLDLRIVRRLEGLLHGEHLGLRPGPGSEPAEARVYQPGEDDVRHMDWSVTARTTIPHVRDIVADRELESWTLLDLSPSMTFGTAQAAKRDVAIGALTAVHALTQRVGDRFGAHFLQSGGRLRRWPARSGRNGLLAILAAATATREEPGADHFAGLHLAEAITDLARTRPRRGLRVVISDFLTPRHEEAPNGWERSMRRLAHRHQVLAVEVLDPRELDLPAVGWITLSDPETGEAREFHISPKVRRRYAEAAHAQREETSAALRRCGVPHLVLRTDRDWVGDIARFVVEQRRTAHLLARHTPAVPR